MPQLLTTTFFRRAIVTLLLSSAVVWAFFRYLAVRSLRGYDVFWHLAAGRLTHETGQVTQSDPFCYTSAELTWTNINWLAQLLYYKVFLAAGFAGVINAATLLFTVVVLCHFVQAQKRNSWALVTLLLLPFLLHALWATTSVRPRMFSFAFLAIEALLLSLPDEDDRFSYWAAIVLVPIFWVWNNTHGGVIYGYGLLGLDALGSCLERAWKHRSLSPTSWVSRRACLLGGIVVLGSAGFFLLHPLGVDAVRYILTYRTRMVPWFYQNTVELLPLGFHTSYGQSLAGYIALTAVGTIMALLCKVRLRFRELLIAFVFLLATCKIQRFIPPFVIVSLPLVTSMWTEILSHPRQRWAKLLENVERIMAAVPATIAVALAGLLAIWTFHFVPQRYLGESPSSVDSWLIAKDRHPISAMRYLKANSEPRHVFSEYSIGGILNWALYPGGRTFIDGRGDFHSLGNTFIEYLTILEQKPGWLQLFEKYDIGFVLLKNNHRLLQALDAQGWINVVNDGKFSLLQRPNPKLP